MKVQSTVPPRRPKRRPLGALGVFQYVDDAETAVHALQREGHRDLRVFSPYPHHRLETALRQRSSAVRWICLTGGIAGITGGFALCIWTVLQWPLVTGGKELVSLPPFVVIGYESMILLAGLLNLAGLLLLAGLPQRRPSAPYDPRFSEDRIGIWVPAEGDSAERARRTLESSGAEEATVHA